ncbi:hypothetical protein F5Y16DRAFT_386787 [Xylariaceae sp. FL0255]|nr:hypothetical protein F5Y16DRAFT_386787 [Xylariaceae sp. FL0255]
MLQTLILRDIKTYVTNKFNEHPPIAQLQIDDRQLTDRLSTEIINKGSELLCDKF